MSRLYFLQITSILCGRSSWTPPLPRTLNVGYITAISLILVLIIWTILANLNRRARKWKRTLSSAVHVPKSDGPLIRRITLINCKLGDYNDLKIHCRPAGFSNTCGWWSLKVRGWSPVMTNGDKRKQLMIWRWNGVVMCDTLCDKLCDTVKHMMWWGVTH